MKTAIIGFVVLMVLLLDSCEKEKPTNGLLTQQEMWNCYQQTEWDSITIKNSLLGKWKWVLAQNYGSPSGGINTESEGVEIAFINDSVLNLMNKDTIYLTTKWTTVTVDEGLFGIETDSLIPLLFGRILICAKTLELNNSYIDGDDNFFLRTE